MYVSLSISAEISGDVPFIQHSKHMDWYTFPVTRGYLRFSGFRRFDHRALRILFPPIPEVRRTRRSRLKSTPDSRADRSHYLWSMPGISLPRLRCPLRLPRPWSVVLPLSEPQPALQRSYSPRADLVFPRPVVYTRQEIRPCVSRFSLFPFSERTPSDNVADFLEREHFLLRAAIQAFSRFGKSKACGCLPH